MLTALTSHAVASLPLTGVTALFALAVLLLLMGGTVTFNVGPFRVTLRKPRRRKRTAASRRR